jgi:orotate phosphoribosyltransferase
MYSQDDILAIMKEKGVLLEGHFKLSSGRHAAFYFQCAKLLQYPDIAGPLCAQLADNFAQMGVTAVIGPAIGAIPISYEVARALGVRSLFAERDNGVMTLRRGFSIGPEDKVVVVEDVITTGGSTKEVIEVVKAAGAEIAGIGAICDRSAGRVDLGYPLFSLILLQIENYMPEECPLCAAGIPVVKPGSRPEKQ